MSYIMQIPQERPRVADPVVKPGGGGSGQGLALAAQLSVAVPLDFKNDAACLWDLERDWESA